MTEDELVHAEGIATAHGALLVALFLPEDAPGRQAEIASALVVLDVAVTNWRNALPLDLPTTEVPE